MRRTIASSFRVGTLSVNFCVYLYLALTGVDRYLNPRIEILTGRRYVGPTSHEIFNVVTDVTSIMVLTFTLLYFAIGQKRLIGAIALAITVHAVVLLFSYVELIRYDVTFEQSPIGYVGPLIGLALAAVNIATYRAAMREERCLTMR